jgi:Rad3-related DNA helicase
VGEVAGAVARLLDRHPERGLIHATYAMAQDLRKHLGEHPRLRWHDPDTRAEVYQAWRRDSTPGVCLVGSGMTEGIDLPGDLCRWQAITKVEWPDLGSPAVAAKQAQRPDWYAWAAARAVQQAVGRSSRGPGDWSVSYILDSSFQRLYTDNQAMFAPSFQAALRYGVV